MKTATAPILLAVSIAVGSACGSGGDDGSSPAADAGPPDAEVAPAFEECSASDQAFVRSAYVATLGRRPRSQAEVNVYTDLMAAVRDESAGGGEDPRAVVVRALAEEPGFVDRWADHVMDALEVPRIEDQSQLSCYGIARRERDDGSLAAYVRDNPPTAGGDGNGPFGMLDLLRSALVLDDLSPIYRANLFALVSRPIPAANVPPVQAELARREDFGLIFDAAYLNRDIVCLACHNSESSVTWSPDPEHNRHWSLPGYFEQALYGAHTGIDVARAHAPFRFQDFVADDGGQTRPWSWTSRCGSFNPQNLPPDPAEIDGRFASLSGDDLTVYDLEDALHRGVDTITASGLPIADDGTIDDPDAAFAYLMAASIVESVWIEVMGTPLTIANYFPRNQAARDVLHQLTEHFVASGFSLRELLVAIMTTPYFNRAEPAAGCGATPYDGPPIYDPWVISDEDETRRGNGAGDAVVPLSGRTLLRAAYAALEWREPFFQSFPDEPFSINTCAQFYDCPDMLEVCEDSGNCCFSAEYWCDYQPSDDELETPALRRFLRGVGVFLKHGERGFRGLDFQARLAFEDRFGRCEKLRPEEDFLDALEARALATPEATLGDVVAALKDRIIGQARVSHEPGPDGVSEKAAIEALFAAELDTPAGELDDLDANLRLLCGALMSSPQFLLSGLPAPDSRYEPILTPDGLTYEAICTGLAERGPDGLSVVCGDGSLTVD